MPLKLQLPTTYLIRQKRRRLICHHSSHFTSRLASSSPRSWSSPSSLLVTSVDTLIVGGGPMGSSTAYHLALMRQQQQLQLQQQQSPTTTLARNPQNRPHGTNNSIWVVERDPTYRSASATVSAAGIRQQFSLKENVEMSAYGRDFLRQAHTLLKVKHDSSPAVEYPHNTIYPSRHPQQHDHRQDPAVHFVEHGYLFLAADETGVAQLQRNHQVQKSADCETHIDLLSPNQLKDEFPWLNCDDLLLGSFGRQGEGWFDPWALLMAWKEKNTHDLGVTYKHATPIDARRNADTGAIEWVLLHDLKRNETEWIQVTGNVINAAGAYAADLLHVLAHDKNGSPLQSPFPVRPRKRSMFFFHCSTDPKYQDAIVPPMAPLTIDPLTGVYFRSEGTRGNGHFVCGVSPPDHQDVDCLDPVKELQHADYHLFDDSIWPALYHRVPAFGNIQLQSAWAGLYEYNTFDQNCILDFHPELPNLLLINGFSGHGLQHSMAAGRAAAELLENDGQFVTLDLSIFGYRRLLSQHVDHRVHEQGIV